MNVLIINICISDLENRKSNLNRNETQNAKHQHLAQRSVLFCSVLFEVLFVPDEASGAAFPGPNDIDIYKH